MTPKVLVVYPDKCTGCRVCEQWCTMSHFNVVNPARARITVKRLHHRYLNTILACTQCEGPACIDVCPVQAISRDPVTLGLLLDEESCTGCAMCADECHTGCIKMDPVTDLALLCDLCGGDPQCVKHCPEAAIQYVEPHQIAPTYQIFDIPTMTWKTEVTVR